MALRITSGIYKNRKLKSPPGKKIRPLSGRIKEALFSILGDYIPGSLFFDVFAGTGNVGLEALSRGAKAVVFVEKNPESAAALKENALALGAIDKIKIIYGDFFDFTSDTKPDILFAGPPYKENLGSRILSHCRNSGLVVPETIIVLQRHYKEQVDPQGFKKIDSRKYGISALDFYKLSA